MDNFTYSPVKFRYRMCHYGIHDLISIAGQVTSFITASVLYTAFFIRLVVYKQASACAMCLSRRRMLMDDKCPGIRCPVP